MSFNDIALRITNLSKRYQVYSKPRDRLKDLGLQKLGQLFGVKYKVYGQTVTALNTLSFEVKHGTTIGVIGTNGSGKSTLLQLICGTLTPTTGAVETKGRVAALLELGAGFNLEFTGRENVYLSAAILGLSDQEIDSRLEDILAFADIGAYIDRPVKVYSSGMYVRLAFAIIAHVDADVLVVDEALAVGDAVFTQKCMRYIRSFQKQGTLIFVSHDLASIQSLCDQCLWLEKGELQAFGDAKLVSEQYLQFSLQEIYGEEAKLDHGNQQTEASPKATIDYEARVSVESHLEGSAGWETGLAKILDVTIQSVSAGKLSVYEGGELVELTIHAKVYQQFKKPILGFLVKDRLGQVLFGENTLSYTNMMPVSLGSDQDVVAKFTFRLPMLPNGEYAVSASFAEGSLEDNIQHHFLHDALILKVSSSKVRWGLVGVQFESVTMEKSND